MTEQEQKAFTAMREALEQALRGMSAAIFGTDTYKVSSRGDFASKVEKQIREALNAANALSHAKPETTPPPEGWAITSESAANVVSEHVPEVGFGKIVGTYGKVVEWPSLPEQPQATEPAGYKLVPVEPTQEMLDAVVTTVDDHLLGPAAEKQYREDWAAMLAAAPEAP